MHNIRKAKRQQQGVGAAHMVGPTLKQESLTKSEQHVRYRNDVVIGTQQRHGENEDFCTLSLPQYLCLGQSGPVRALKYGEHGLGMRPVYVGPVVLYRKRSPTKGSHLALGSTASANPAATGWPPFSGLVSD